MSHDKLQVILEVSTPLYTTVIHKYIAYLRQFLDCPKSQSLGTET